ncbi:MAG TPA: TolC family protein [Anaeromyxobacter sp.]|nr:TolC family protein [Anaeromyxobacter sp.]
MTLARLLLLTAVLPALAAAQAAPAAPAPGTPTARVVTLEEVIRTAREHQPQLRQALAATTAAVARSDEARAPLLPQLNATAYYQRATANSSVPGSIGAGRPTSWSGTNSWSAGAFLSQTLFDLGAIQRWRSSGATADAQRATQQATELDVVANAETAYFTARAARDLVGVAQDTLTNQEAHLRQVEGFVKVGTHPEIDLATARANRANAQVQLIQARNLYAISLAQLAQAMGLDGPADFEISSEALPPVPGEQGPGEPLLAEALAARPELASLHAQRSAQELTRGAAQAGYLPTLGAQAGLTQTGPALDTTSPNWSAQLTLSWSLFAGGLTRAQVQEADANLDAIKAQEDALRIQVRVDVEQARLQVVASLAAVDSAAEALVNAKEQLRLAEGRYQAGAGSIIELGDAQVAATSAGAQKVQADFSLASARAKLLRALGRT